MALTLLKKNNMNLKLMALEVKKILTSRKGWTAWFIANIITTSAWFIPLGIGFILQDQRLYVLAGSIWALMLSPIIPVWPINLLIATFFYKKVLK
jgi:hypothetical protein